MVIYIKGDKAMYIGLFSIIGVIIVSSSLTSASTGPVKRQTPQKREGHTNLILNVDKKNTPHHLYFVFVLPFFLLHKKNYFFVKDNFKGK